VIKGVAVLGRPDELEEWMSQAVCASVDPELWFPAREGSSVTAKRICKGFRDRPPCPVRLECLEYALRWDERFGVWGGLSERERNKLKKQREK
jgi:WhiB family redox-sensing transcriptional regulator